MGEIYANNAAGKLATAITDADTTLELEPGHNLPSLGAEEWFRLTLYRWEFFAEGIREFDHEVVRVTGVSGDTLTVERALEGGAQEFDAGTNAELRPTAKTFEKIREDAASELSGHSTRTDNPHGVTAEQAGADPEGSAAAAESAANTYTDSHASETSTHGAPAYARLVHSSSLIREAVEAQRMGLTRQRLIRKDGAGTLEIDRKITGASGDATGWNPESEDDGTVGSLALGDDIYIYWADGQLVASRNDDGPDGATDWLMLGGFHYGRVRPFSEAYNASFTCPIEIIPNAVWDQIVRPRCNPTGMVEVISGSVWWGIYLASEGPESWPETTIRSAYDVAPITGQDGYTYFDFIRLSANSGGRVIRGYGEFRSGSYGVPQGATGLSAGSFANTGQHADYGFDCVSCLNVDQPSGNAWQTTAEYFDRDSDSAWSDDLNVGRDSSHDVGEWRGGDLSFSLVGGGSPETDKAGAGCIITSFSPWGVGGASIRFACDSL
ncbi:hypothetical protein [Thioalkalivibrio sp. ARh3]|uniref:phage major tropism determinant n=1 Tax=Thioalkalivibrio sp. ARh3 TaxID=1158148 RepID=UPI000382B593|nr:hypothetical protein [Thioalkalivibrio sp. ARh3]